jgi:DNA-binding CsgD family transcriptional regulator
MTTTLYDRIVAARKLTKFGSVIGQLECDRDDWASKERFMDGSLDYPGEGAEYAAAFQALLDIVGELKHSHAPEVCGAYELLSPRERDVCELLRTGMPLKRIHTRLGISPHTARNHLKHVFRKTGTHSQVELISLLNGVAP